MDQQTPQGSARSRAFLAEFLHTAAAQPELPAAIEALMGPGSAVHLQNGDTVGPEQARLHMDVSRSMFPNMEMEVVDAFFPDDRLVVQVTFSGTAGPGMLLAPAGTPFVSGAALVGRVDERLRLSEVWSYLNPGFAFSYPPRGLAQSAPPADGAGVEQGRALYQGWMARAEAGEDFVAVVADSMAPEGVAHLGNGDVGRAEDLRALFASIVGGLPDLSLTVEAAMVTEARVAVQFLMTGTHQGMLGLFPPTGRVLPSRGMVLARADQDARLAELWLYVAPGYAIGFPPASAG